jgi:hypothetical protein
MIGKRRIIELIVTRRYIVVDRSSKRENSRIPSITTIITTNA